MAVSRDRGALSVEGHEINRRTDSAGGVICSAETMLHESLHELAATAGDIWTADTGRWQCPANSIDSIIVKLVELRRRAAPITDVRFVPDLPKPGFYLSAIVSLNAMLRPLKHQLRPL